MGVDALCSSKFVASNAALQHILPSPVVIDLIFRDGGISPLARRSGKMARVASRGWSILRSLRHKNRGVSSSSNSTLRSGVTSRLEQPGSRSSQSFICRANSSEQAGLPEREDGEESPHYGLRQGVEKQPDPGKQGKGHEARMQSSMVSVKYGVANPEADGFRRSSSPDFEDEFFTRMMVALEASHKASPRVNDLRACLTSTAALFDAEGALSGACDSPRPSPGHGVDSPQGAVTSTSTQGKEQGPICALGMGGVALPSSIKKLRRRNSEVKGENRALSKKEAGCAMKNAFSSMVYMIKVVQSHALQIRQVLFSEWDVQEVLLLVHREMHSSFLWLFQQVFACTPKLMVSVMILLANFTVYSMGENVAIATVTETPAPIAFFLSTYGNPQAALDPHFTMHSISFSKQPMGSPHPNPPNLGAGSGGNNNTPSPSTAESFDGDSWLKGALNQRYMFSQKDSIRDFPSPALAAEAARRFQESVAPERRPSHHEMMKAWVESSMKNLKLKGGEPLHHVQLEQETIRRLVAPVVAHLESDNYACFDRTDLEYQHALSKDSCNPLLLANYAQFLYVVRHDNDRAEGYFHQAMQADPLDSTILGRFASFLWLGRGNRAAAERAYKAAMAADPGSSFPAGNYAHFLWHAGDGDSCGPPGAMAV